MPKIALPLKRKCWVCEGRGHYIGPYDPVKGSLIVCGCDDGERYNLAELFAAVEAIDAAPASIKLPEEGEPDYVSMITLLGDEDHEDMVVEARGDSHEEAMVNAIAEWNKRYA